MKKTLKRWFYSYFPGFSGRFPYFGVKVFFPKNAGIFNVACRQGIYEKDNVFLMRHLLKPNSFFFDIGANIGLTSIPMLQFCETCKVVSFEPSPNVLPFLQRTAENSVYKDRWVVIGKATGKKIGTSNFFTSNSGNEALGGFRDTKRADTQVEIQVPVTTLDEEWNNLQNPQTSVIKIDVEGAELLVLQGGVNLIQQENPAILLEWHTVNLKAYDCPPESLLSFCKDINYKIYALPDLISVQNRNELLLHMRKTENFLLLPIT
ncbi:FkbM family methyltransferase [Aphanizomenon sp. UHCC 0183]|uniref:FkbM family methyltransferase n=1 Tax=Aphanizomenon sp. UHCC 0183 TaxID=2590028 RepID=UPI00144575F3|nr:FkbM family methyltransferase [Aphanizomenon sp. UHCC 0183]MTJ32787.1 FkbM family methyltransferase [Aphanizomenon sp. UHCC 0183]